MPTHASNYTFEWLLQSKNSSDHGYHVKKNFKKTFFMNIKLIREHVVLEYKNTSGLLRWINDIVVRQVI